MSLPFDVTLFRALRAAGPLGAELEFHEVLGSSNDRALERARAGAPHGLLVLADEQRGARGRHGRSWTCAPRLGVWASLVLRPSRPAAEHAQLPLVFGLALCEALSLDLGADAVTVRWPNDLDVRGRKVAGILCERDAAGEAVIAGFGVNVCAGAAPPELAASATTLEEEGCRWGREAVLAAILARFGIRLAAWDSGGFDPLRAEYLRRMALVGERVRVSTAGGDAEGAVEGIDAAGALLLRTTEGARAFHAGTVERVR